MQISAIASHVSATGMVGNPNRTRGLDPALLDQPNEQETPTLVGNPRRTRGLRVEDFQVA